MTMSRKLGLTIVAAALIPVYGCGKEEPKKAAEAAKPAAPPPEEIVTVKIGHAGQDDRFSYTDLAAALRKAAGTK